MLSKCIKMPKYSFKRNLFFAIWGGVHDWFWPTRHTSHELRQPHQYIVLAVPCIMSATPRILSAVRHALCQPYRVWQETFSQHQVQNFWHFLGWKNKFFQNCSKLPKNYFRTIKILFFFPDFLRLQEWDGWVRPNLKNSRFFFN